MPQEIHSKNDVRGYSLHEQVIYVNRSAIHGTFPHIHVEKINSWSENDN